jgi:uncharacterized protein (TIGR02246 family)
MLIALTIGGHAQAQETPIQKRITAFIEAYNAQDAEAISGFYTEKGALLPPQGKALFGRPPIAAHYANAFENGVTGLKYRILEIDQTSQDTAIEIGETQVAFNEQTIIGRSMHVWKNVNGQWLLHRDIYHVLAMTK